MFLAQTIHRAIAKHAGVAEADFSVFPSERPAFGDYSTNVAFVTAKRLSASPFTVAEDLRKQLEADAGFGKLVDRIEVKNGYLNFFLSLPCVAFALRDAPRPMKVRGAPTVLVEYSSPNIGKSLSIAHIRSTIIGDALARMHGFLGARVITDSHVGDWGMLAGKLIAAYKLFARKPVSQLTIGDMQELYVYFTTYEKDKPDYTAMAREETRKLQQEDKESMRVWQVLVKNSIKEFNRMYKVLGIMRFDHQYGESHYRAAAQRLVHDFVAKKYAHASQGALIVDLDEFHLPPMLIQKSDEAFLYATSDLATIVERQREFRADEVLYVVANEQALHFEQLFAAAQKFGLAQGTRLVHVKFGMILGEDGKKLSTRKGKTILLEEVLGQAKAKARALATSKNPRLSEASLVRIASIIGVGAIKYNDLSQNRNTDIAFDWDAMLSLEGNSAPYIQYAYARLKNIMVKAGKAPRPLGARDFMTLEEDERALARHLVRFKDAVKQATQEQLPNLVANFLYETAARANAWYEQFPVLKAAGMQRAARLSLAHGVCAILERGLDLLGIGVLPKI